MNLSTKYFLAVFTLLASHALLGVSSAYAMQCEREIEEQWANAPVRDNGKKDMPALWHNGRGFATLEEAKEKWFDEIMDAINNSDRKWADPYYGSMTCQAYAAKWIPIYRSRNEPGAACTAQYMAQTNCQNPEVFKYRKGSGQQSSSSSNKSSNNGSSNSRSASNGGSKQQTSNNQSNQSTTYNSSASSQNQITSESNQESSEVEMAKSDMKSNFVQKTAAYNQKNQGRGKKHNKDAVANRCIQVKGNKVLNTCNYDVEVVFCAENPDPNSKHAFEMANGFNCANDSKGMWGISANDALMGVFTADSVNVFACKKPSLPGAEYDRQKKMLIGRCSEY